MSTMKIFAIRHKDDKPRKDLAYLFYFEYEKEFLIEIPEGAEAWELPLMISSYAERGVLSLGPRLSAAWVRERIVPVERQNIGQILKELGLREYDEYALLTYAMGRCAQDDFYLADVSGKEPDRALAGILASRVDDVIAVGGFELILMLRSGAVKRVDLSGFVAQRPGFSVFVRAPKLFGYVKPQAGGLGIRWSEELYISGRELQGMGEELGLETADLRSFAERCVVTAAEAAALLGCSRQYVNALAKSGALAPLKAEDKATLFLRADVLKRRWG